MLSKINQEKIQAILEQKNFKIYNNLFIAYPDNESDINKLFILANKFKFKIMLMGTGSSITDQYAKLENTLYLSTRNFSRILELDPVNGFIKVESGILISRLIKYVEENNLHISLEHSADTKLTLGGLLASLDPFSAFAYSIKGIEFLLPTGEKIRYGGKIAKNVAGYDLTRLMLGSFGKFGIISSVLIDLTPGNSFFYAVESVDDIRMNEFEVKDNNLYDNLKNSLDPNHILW